MVASRIPDHSFYYYSRRSHVASPRVTAYHQLLTNDSRNQCPAGLEEVAEAYAMGTLPAEQAVSFEAHFIGCDRCAAAVQETAEYVAAMREAARKLRSDKKEE